jgi:hypothetical protein
VFKGKGIVEDLDSMLSVTLTGTRDIEMEDKLSVGLYCVLLTSGPAETVLTALKKAIRES